MVGKMNLLGVQAIIGIATNIFFIMVSFWALKGLRIESWIKKNHVAQARILYVFFSITIGYTVSNFVLEFLNLSKNLIFLLN
ncbi:hypothetical protein IV74_GL000320 [Carnobacterium divergens DSM 20623]|uniref:DUF1146 domain-containing protein n=2 Tax=Carnobacterium divergens TaxID=2748 RepID=A0A0R2I6H9_CARDV|nr:DUF1146 family protein [Carnobacterium divergens]KRN57338.1 hypothetical protein IV74_GL000320 [Carnobacterium divergens DSM 20623]